MASLGKNGDVMVMLAIMMLVEVIVMIGTDGDANDGDVQVHEHPAHVCSCRATSYPSSQQ